MNYVFLSKTLTSQTVVSLSTVNHNTYLASLVDCCDYHIRLVNSIHEIFLELQLYISGFGLGTRGHRSIGYLLNARSTQFISKVAHSDAY